MNKLGKKDIFSLVAPIVLVVLIGVGLAIQFRVFADIKQHDTNSCCMVKGASR